LRILQPGGGDLRLVVPPHYGGGDNRLWNG